jgi:hypothetical protein
MIWQQILSEFCSLPRMCSSTAENHSSVTAKHSQGVGGKIRRRSRPTYLGNPDCESGRAGCGHGYYSVPEWDAGVLARSEWEWWTVQDLNL